MVFRKLWKFLANIGENPRKFTHNKPNYIRASPVHPIAMKLGTIVAFWMRNKTCFLDFWNLAQIVQFWPLLRNIMQYCAIMAEIAQSGEILFLIQNKSCQFSWQLDELVKRWYNWKVYFEWILYGFPPIFAYMLRHFLKTMAVHFDVSYLDNEERFLNSVKSIWFSTSRRLKLQNMGFFLS